MTTTTGGDPREQRRNAALRALIDEMLQQVRDLNRNVGSWTPEERAQAESELASIMSRVRSEAAQREQAATKTGGT